MCLINLGFNYTITSLVSGVISSLVSDVLTSLLPGALTSLLPGEPASLVSGTPASLVPGATTSTYSTPPSRLLARQPPSFHFPLAHHTHLIPPGATLTSSTAHQTHLLAASPRQILLRLRACLYFKEKMDQNN